MLNDIHTYIQKIKAQKQLALTLAETLVVIFLLGVLASETIPILLKDIETKKKKVLFKQTISQLYNAARWGVYEERLQEWFPFWEENLKIIKKDEANDIVYLANGVKIEGLVSPSTGTLCGGCNQFTFITLDYNGDKGPNENGVDRLPLKVCAGRGGDYSIKCDMETRVGRCGYVIGNKNGENVNTSSIYVNGTNTSAECALFAEIMDY